MKINRNYSGCIHLVIGGKENNDFPGRIIGISNAMSLDSFLDDVSLINSFNSASGDLAWKKDIDKCGAIVYPSNCNIANHSSWDVDKVIAAAGAHEIGHCLGLGHHNYQVYGNKKNIMHESLGDMVVDFYSLWAIFDKEKLDGTGDLHQQKWDGLNTRHKLGIECVDIRERSLDESTTK